MLGVVLALLILFLFLILFLSLLLTGSILGLGLGLEEVFESDSKSENTDNAVEECQRREHVSSCRGESMPSSCQSLEVEGGEGAGRDGASGSWA